MNFEEWLLSIIFGLRRRFKVNGVLKTEFGLKVQFENGFCYGVNLEKLKFLWNNSENEGFRELCNDIKHVYMQQILSEN